MGVLRQISLHTAGINPSTFVPVPGSSGICYAVGGFVRDTLRGKPCNDVDLVVSHRFFADFCQNIYTLSKDLGYEATHLKTVTLKNGACPQMSLHSVALQISTESYEIDIRELKDVLFGDSLCRDFTCNAIYVNILNGQIEDPLGGIRHLREKRLVGCSSAERVFVQNVRMFRAVRMEVVLGVSMDEEIRNYIVNSRGSARTEGMSNCLAEFAKILTLDQHLPKMLANICKLDLLSIVFFGLFKQSCDTIDKLNSSVLEFASRLLYFYALPKDSIETAYPGMKLQDLAKVFFIFLMYFGYLANPGNSTIPNQEENVKNSIQKLMPNVANTEYYTKTICMLLALCSDTHKLTTDDVHHILFEDLPKPLLCLMSANSRLFIPMVASILAITQDASSHPPLSPASSGHTSTTSFFTPPSSKPNYSKLSLNATSYNK